MLPGWQWSTRVHTIHSELPAAETTVNYLQARWQWTRQARNEVILLFINLILLGSHDSVRDDSKLASVRNDSKLASVRDDSKLAGSAMTVN